MLASIGSSWHLGATSYLILLIKELTAATEADKKSRGTELD